MRSLILQLDLLINQQDVSHLALKVGIAPFHVIGYLMGLQGLGCQNPMHGGFRGARQTGMPLSHRLPTDMLGQSSPAPNLSRVAELFRFRAGQVHDPGFGLFRHHGRAAMGRVFQTRRHPHRQRFVDPFRDTLAGHLHGLHDSGDVVAGIIQPQDLGSLHLPPGRRPRLAQLLDNRTSSGVSTNWGRIDCLAMPTA